MEKPKRKRKPLVIEIDLQEVKRGFDFGVGVITPVMTTGFAIAIAILLVEALGIIKFALIAVGISICYCCLWLITKQLISIFRQVQ